MINIFIFTHGSLSVALKENARVFFGDEVESIVTFSFNPQDNLDDLKNSIKQEMLSLSDNGNSKKEVLVFVDIKSGTPFNITAQLFIELQEQVAISCFTGVNLPLLMEALLNKNIFNLQQMKSHLLEVSKDTISNMEDFLFNQ